MPITLKRRFPILCLEFLFLTSCCCPQTAWAQNFRIYTPVFNEAVAAKPARIGAAPQTPVISRSQAFFHAGEVYDVIEPDGELILFQPSAQRYVILHQQRSVVTTLKFDELLRQVRDAEVRAEEYLLRAKSQPEPPSAKSLEWIEFQLRPQFTETYDRQRGILKLSHPLMTYEVECLTPEQPEAAQNFLRYCDWTARLNYVLHPQAPLPAPRLTLNESLRKRGLMPLSVTLKAQVGGGLHFRAEHQIQWTLESHDRRQLNDWDELLRSEQLRSVPFLQFQELLLAKK